MIKGDLDIKEPLVLCASKVYIRLSTYKDVPTTSFHIIPPHILRRSNKITDTATIAMSDCSSTPATEHSDFAPGLGSSTELRPSDGVGCTSRTGGEEETLQQLRDQMTVTQQMHVDLVNEYVRDLEAARQEKEAEVQAVTERMEREAGEKDEISQRNIVRCIYSYRFSCSNGYQDHLREFWNEARLGKKTEADRACLLDANLTKKTQECEGLTATIATLKRALAFANVRA